MRYIRALDRGLTWVGAKITTAVGTMWCALAFAAIAMYGLPAAIHQGALVAWFAQTFLQLVLLSIIMVGQAVESRRTEQRDQETHDAVKAELAIVQQIALDTHRALTGRPHPFDEDQS